MANFYTCDPHCHFWILQNPQWFFGLWGSLENRLWRNFFKKCVFKFHLRPYGEFLYLRPVLPFLNITKPAMVFWTLGVIRKQSVKIFFLKKCVFHIPPPSLWRISILATCIAISEYYKTRKCFLDSGGYQETVWEEKMEKVCISNFSSVAMVNFYNCDPRSHFWILQNPQWFMDSGCHHETG